MIEKTDIPNLEDYARKTSDDPLIGRIWPFWIRLSQAM